MAEDNTETAKDSAEKPKKSFGRPFTPETSRAVQAKANAAKRIRREMRQKMLMAMVNAGLENYFEKALKTNDDKLMTIVEKASKLIGADFGASEEAIQRVDAKVDAKTQGKLEVVVKGLGD